MNPGFSIQNPNEPVTDTRTGTTRRFILVLVLVMVYLVPTLFYGIVKLLLPERSATVGNLLTSLAALAYLVLGLWGLHDMKLSLRSLGIRLGKAVEAFGVILLVWGIYALLLLASLNFQLTGFFQAFQTPLSALIAYWLFVGPAEEILFRGYILNWLRTRFGSLGKIKRLYLAVFVSSLIFATGHAPRNVFRMVQGQMQPEDFFLNIMKLTILGILFAYIYLRTENILLAALVHGGSDGPLIGITNDLFPLILSVILIEVVHFIHQRIRKQEKGISMNLAGRKGV